MADTYGGAVPLVAQLPATVGASLAPDGAPLAAVSAPLAPQRVVKGTGTGDERARPSVAPTGSAAVLASRGGFLPFTGFDVLLIIAGGGVLLAVGVGMRRLARPPV